MWLLLSTVPLVWSLVLTVHLARNYRVLVRLVRWTAWVYLLVLSVVAAEVLREGFIVLKPPSTSPTPNTNTNTNTNNDNYYNSGGYGNGNDFLQGARGGVVADVGAWWFAWFVVVALSAVFPMLLVPAVGLPVLLLRHPAFRLVVDFGLARLGWTAAVYNPAGFWYGGVLRPLVGWGEWVAGVVQGAFSGGRGG
ncbi:hypothetical protein PG991_006809 [Apiospora marii]|uniref:Wax synthase domain-containing protein n=1 Tax=Apiospora marii TaxID=335849 RepID=A0ABR1RYV0_9PEZI